MDRAEATILQHLYQPDIINAVRIEVNNCETCQLTKLSNKKYGKLPAKLYEEIPWNKLYVDLVGHYITRIKVKKEKLHLKAVTIIDPVTGWFEITQHTDKGAVSIVNLVETTWLSI